MTRQTSIDVYRRIEAEGLLAEKTFEVYALLFREGPLTGSEVNHRLKSKSGHKRLADLKNRKAVYEVRLRPCTRTGEDVAECDVTDRVPIPLPKDAPTLKQIREFLQAVQHVPLSADVEVVRRWLKKRAKVQESTPPPLPQPQPPPPLPPLPPPPQPPQQRRRNTSPALPIDAEHEARWRNRWRSHG